MTSFMTSLPMFFTKALDLNCQFASSAPWKQPIYMGFKGTERGKPENKEIVIAYEWPIPLIDVELSKDQMELLHLRRVLHDYKFRTNQELFLAERKGDDPPDFYCALSSGKELGVDLVQFTPEKRRKANARFERFKKYISQNYSFCNFKQLRGHIVYFWWNSEGEPKPSDITISEEEMAETLTILAKHVPNPPKYEGEELPKVHSEMCIEKTATGANFYSVPMFDCYPQTRFFFETGFELSLAFSTQFSIFELWDEISRIIQKHDKHKIQTLIINVGAPDRNGYCYSSDESLMRFAIDHPIPLKSLGNIKVVYGHLWSTGQIFVLHPEIKMITDPIFPDGVVLANGKFG